MHISFAKFTLSLKKLKKLKAMANKWYEVGQSKRIRCFFIVRVVSSSLKMGTFNFQPLEWGDHVIHFFSKD
jgi:hypothetical protein